MNNRGRVLSDAIAECERFLKAAKAFRPHGSYQGDSVGRAAAKRASMDATRALARLRKAYGSDWSSNS